MNIVKHLAIGIVGSLLTVSVHANSIKVPVHSISDKGQDKIIGSVTFKDSQFGLLIKPDLESLKSGMHGFHIHQNPNCGNDGKAAGGHYDPKNTQKHLGPYSTKGHLGDLPVLFVNSNNHAQKPTLAPRLGVDDILGHALIIHKHGDNYSDQPKPLGGGGKRIACGVIKQ